MALLVLHSGLRALVIGTAANEDVGERLLSLRVLISPGETIELFDTS